MKALASIFLPYATLSLLTGCQNLPDPCDFRVEARSGAGLLVASSHVACVPDGLQVSGYVARGAYYSASAGLHLDVEVVSPTGGRLAFAPTPFSPNQIPHRNRRPSNATYATQIPGRFPAGSRVRVAVHPASLEECLATLSPAS